MCLSASPELEKCYHFTQLAVELNELENGVAPTDSRLRPDQRMLENGKTAESDRVKVLLEQKQRATRAEREKAAETLGSSQRIHLIFIKYMNVEFLPARQLCCEQVLFLAASVCASVCTKSRKLLVGN